jgi:hypothetical protein
MGEQGLEPPGPRRRGSKIGRNEARKLAATFANNVGVAFFLAASLQPALTFVQRERALTLAAGLGSTIFLLLAVAGFLTAQATVRRLED